MIAEVAASCSSRALSLSLSLLLRWLLRASNIKGGVGLCCLLLAVLRLSFWSLGLFLFFFFSFLNK